MGLVLLLSGCGGGAGGIFIGVDGTDESPTVSLVSGSDTTTPGGVVRLVAAAIDDQGIAQVQFYRQENGRDTLLGSDGAAPYQLVFDVPEDADTDLRFFARAVDDGDQEADSPVVTVTLE